jgi:rod shape-determining protein MreB
VVVGVPYGITNVETRAVRDAALGNGAREVFIVEEPMAAAIGIRLPIHDPVGSMVVDIGGGTTDIAVVSLGGIVRAKSVRIAGDKFDADIVSHLRSVYKVLIGEKTAETLKIHIGRVMPGPIPLEASVRGRDLVTGLPREIVITDADIREAVSLSVDNLIEAMKEVLEGTPPEIVADVMHRGIHLVGGGALLGGMDELLRECLHIPIHLAEDPLTAVARGAGIILEDLPRYRELVVTIDDELPPVH